MIYPQDRNIHRPLHLFNQSEIYFITSRTFEKKDYFIGQKKEILKNCLIKVINKYQPTVYAWVIVNNHYHLLLKFGCDELIPGEYRGEKIGCDELRPSGSEGEIRYGEKPPKAVIDNNKFRPPNRRTQFVRPDDGAAPRNQLAKFIQHFHRNSARLINKIDNQPGRRVWYQYWDVNVKKENDFYTYFNYINLNPIKHGLLKNRKELENYKFCSYQNWLDRMVEERSADVIGSYPVEAGEMETN